MIKRFWQDTKDVFKIIKENSNSKFIRYVFYIILIISIPLLFLLDLITYILRIEPKNERK